MRVDLTPSSDGSWSSPLLAADGRCLAPAPTRAAGRSRTTGRSARPTRRRSCRSNPTTGSRRWTRSASRSSRSQDLSGDYDVDLTGHISMPLIGEVEAANLTTAQLDEQLTQKLGEKYLEHPDVSVGDQGVDQALGDGRRRGQAGRIVPDRRTDFADAGGRAGRRHDRGRQCAPGGGLPDHRRTAPGRGVRPDGDPPRPGPGPADLSRRHRRRRRIVDQGAAEADLPEHSAACRSSGRSRCSADRSEGRT